MVHDVDDATHAGGHEGNRNTRPGLVRATPALHLPRPPMSNRDTLRLRAAVPSGGPRAKIRGVCTMLEEAPELSTAQQDGALPLTLGAGTATGESGLMPAPWQN
jgi:hypothetical protein